MLKRSIDKIHPSLLPVVLMLKGGRASVLLDVDDDSGTAKVILPETGSGTLSLEIAELESQYDGHVFFVRPQHRLDERAPEILSQPSEHWFWSTILRNWPTYRDVLIASFLINLFALAIPFFILNVYDRVVPNNAVETLWVLALGVGMIAVFELALRGARSFFLDRAARRTDVEISSLLFERVLGIKAGSRPTSVGSFANNLQEFESIRDFVTSTTITTVVDVPFVLLFLVAIWWIAGPLVWVPALGVPLILIYALIVQVPMRKAVEKSFRATSQKNATLVESLVGNEMVKATCAEGQFQRTWEQAVGHIARWRNTTRLLSSSVTNVAMFVSRLAIVGVVVYGVYQIAGGMLSLGGLIACVILSRRALTPITQVANIITRFFQARAALKSLNRIMDLPVERERGQSYVQRPVLKGGVQFDKVTFGYSRDEPEVLRDVSFSLEPGEHVGIIGRIGSGKTTLGKLLLGFYEPTSGAVRVDGIDIRHIDPTELRRHLGYVPQDVFLFYGSVRDNMTLGARHVEDEKVVRAAHTAGLSEFVDQHPKGYDMEVGERGSRLSGGQRQSIAIGRALLLDPPIQVLDEPTNSMDNRTEQLLMSRLADELKGRTLVLMTHRVSLLELVDRVIVLDFGTVVADGPKEEILAAIEEGKIRVARTKT